MQLISNTHSILEKLRKVPYCFEVLVFAVFVLTRLPYLGHDNFNTDVFKWKARIYNFGSGVFNMEFENTIQRYHPGVTLMWLGTLAVKANTLYTTYILPTAPDPNSLEALFLLDYLQKIFIVSVLGLAVANLFYMLRNLVDLVYALLFFLLLNFEPFFLGLTRVIHLEGLLSVFMLCSFISLVYFYEKGIRKYLILSAFFSALAVLTKTSALFLVPFSGLVCFYYERSLITSTKKFLYWLGVFFISVFLVWPAFWVVPLQALETLRRGIFDAGVEEGHIQLYFGRTTENPGLTFYFVVLLLRSSFLALLGFLAGLISYKLGKLPISQPTTRNILLLSLVFSAFYFIEMSLPSKKLDRYILPALLGMLFMATYFYQRLYISFSKKHFPVLLFLTCILFNWLYYLPDYFSYYNPLFGGLRIGIYILEPKWLIGGSNITEYFSSILALGEVHAFGPGENFEKLLHQPNVDSKLVVGFPEKYYTQIWPFIQEIGGWATIQDLTPHARKTRYFVYPVWEDSGATENRFDIRQTDVIKLRGVELYKVYERMPSEVK